MKWRPRYSLRTLVVFLLLATSAAGLWRRSARRNRWRPIMSMEVSKESRFNSDTSIAGQWNFEYKGVKFEGPRYKAEIERRDWAAIFAPFDNIEVKEDGDVLKLSIRGSSRVANGLTISTFDPSEGLPVTREYGDGQTCVGLSEDQSMVLTEGMSGGIICAMYPGPYARRGLAIWERLEVRGHLQWPELWLTFVFAGLFIWSVVRDRRSLRARSEPTE